MQSNYFVVGVRTSADTEYGVVGGTIYITSEDAEKESEALKQALKKVGAVVDTKIFHLQIKGELECVTQ